eukprot:451289-Alexandrium_andersonii.AAC.1
MRRRGPPCKFRMACGASSGLLNAAGTLRGAWPTGYAAASLAGLPLASYVMSMARADGNKISPESFHKLPSP